MPKMLVNQDKDQEVYNIKGAGSFTFSAIRPQNLSETEYTLASVLVDTTGSVDGFEDNLLEMLKSVVLACKKNPKKNNLLLRVAHFNSIDGIEELNGFKPVTSIDENSFQKFNPGGNTPLCDALYSGIGATVDYGENLVDQDFNVNGIIFVITDGGENASSSTPSMIKDKLKQVVVSEKLDSMRTILIGINTIDCSTYLEDFKNFCELDDYIDCKDATPNKIAKLGQFISKSISSTSQALGTGQSVPIGSLTI